MVETPPTISNETLRGVRRASVITAIGSLVLAALIGIVALLSGDFGEPQFRILMTTLAVGAFATTALCHLAIVTRAVRWLGFIGIAASIGAVLFALVLIWADIRGPESDFWFKGFITLMVVALSLAHANLLLLLADHSSPWLKAGLGITLVAIAIVAIMLLLPLITNSDFFANDAYGKFLGVVAIIDALGTISLPILAIVLRNSAGEAHDDVRLNLRISSVLASRLDSVAAIQGVTREQTAAVLLETALEPKLPADATSDASA